MGNTYAQQAAHRQVVITQPCNLQGNANMTDGSGRSFDTLSLHVLPAPYLQVKLKGLLTKVDLHTSPFAAGDNKPYLDIPLESFFASLL